MTSKPVVAPKPAAAKTAPAKTAATAPAGGKSAKPDTAAATAAANKKSAGKTAYEQQRAAKAGQTHDEWLKAKAKTTATAAKPAKAAKKPGLLSRLIDKAHKPI